MTRISPWNPYASECPTRFILQRIADKWAILILGLLHEKKWRFNALLKQIEGLSRKVLSQTLKRLERDGLVSRHAYPTVPITVEYSLTPLGITLSQAVSVTLQWAEENADAVLAAQKAYDQGNAEIEAEL
ncbi:winged helix-turn-helix transcriptional regulator [Pseudomonas sp. GL-RE-29]|uniref:winged helix-turn-helix transcriptional regulator n=1 Tax=Pseudomonas TaxID=286 RepID=UPI001CBC277A|nr:helix-turn-helix domain-containing protein [Pseudomonas sp. GL-RE-29]